jgi:hypothetical protein
MLPGIDCGDATASAVFGGQSGVSCPESRQLPDGHLRENKGGHPPILAIEWVMG